ncbi:MAG: flagellar export chaperone FliS [Bryobacteraceae bacterium]
MTNYDDPYRAYVEGSVFSSDPVRLVVALYEGAIECTRQSRRCLETGDIWGRAQAVSKAVNILTELIASLDHKKGGEISVNLAGLYNYMQRKLMEGHAGKSAAAFEEVEKLLQTLLHAWYVAAEQKSGLPQLVAGSGYGEESARMGVHEAAGAPYADYFTEFVGGTELAFLF